MSHRGAGRLFRQRADRAEQVHVGDDADHPVALALSRAFGGPIAAPSANLSGEPPPTSGVTVAATLGERIDLLLDAGETPGGVPSTLVDLTVTPPRILRHGAIPEAAVWEVLGGG